MKQKIYLLLFLISGICCFNSSFAQDPNFSVEIASPAYINSNTYEFNIVVKAINTTTSFQLRTFQAGIYVNSAWLNGGSLTIQTVPTFTELSSPGYNGNYQWNSTDKLINCSVNYGVKPTTATCISSLVGIVNTTVTRIRLVNSATFTCNTPDLKFNYVQNMSPLRLRTSVSWRINNSCATNYDLFYPNRTYSGVVIFNGETYSISDADGRSPVLAAVNAGFCFSQLKLTAFIQGFYLGGHQMESTLMIQGAPHGQAEQTDSITIELHPAATPAVISQSYRSVLNANGDAYALFPSSVNGSSYYIAVKGRNLLETWSANPITMNTNFNYNFTDNNAKAFQDIFNTNTQMVQVENGVWAFYNGDVNQDGAIDGLDFNDTEVDVNAFAFGYFTTDVTNAGPVDGLDFNQLEQNSSLFLFVSHP